MRDKVRKIVNFRFDRYQDMEIILKRLAEKGLLLEQCGPFGWTFRKDKPQDLTYTITFFEEGSVFHPDMTANEQVYHDYAKAAGWDFVAGYNQMQIFCTQTEHIVPFETDENEKLKNIKRCMKKGFVFPTVLMAAVFLLNLIVQFSSFRVNPIGLLTNSINLLAVFMFSLIILYCTYQLLGYFLWCKRSECSIRNGGKCVNNTGLFHKIVDAVFIGILLVSLLTFFMAMIFEISWIGVLFCTIQVPVLMFLYWASIRFWKRKKASATKNKVISFIVLMIVNFAYITFGVWLLLQSNINLKNTSSEYSSIYWPADAVNNQEYKLYQDNIPLTCEDLYGQIQYDYYSYEQERDSTFLMTKNQYRQSALPAKDAPPQIAYDIIETKFDSVYRIAANHLLRIPEWSQYSSFQEIDNKIFHTIKAYQRYYEDKPTGEYILCFKNKMIVLQMEEPLTDRQIAIVIEKLNL